MQTASDEVAESIRYYRHGRVPRAVRQRQVMELAEALFAEKGYSAASMDELARRAGVSKPVVYELAGSKDELFHACMSKVAGELAERVTAAVEGVPDSEPRRRFVAGTEAWFCYVAERRAVWDGLLSGDDSPATKEVAEIRRRQAEVVADLLARGAAATWEGGPGSRLVFEALAHLVNGATESLAAWWRDHPQLSPAALAELSASVIFPGLEALGNRAGDDREPLVS